MNYDYIHNTINHDLQLYVSLTTTLTTCLDVELTHVDPHPDTYVFLGDNLISWFSKPYHIVFRSTFEAEYHVAKLVSKND